MPEVAKKSTPVSSRAVKAQTKKKWTASCLLRAWERVVGEVLEDLGYQYKLSLSHLSHTS